MEEAGAADGVLSDFVSAPAVVITNYIKRHFPIKTNKLSIPEMNAIQAQAGHACSPARACLA